MSIRELEQIELENHFLSALRQATDLHRCVQSGVTDDVFIVNTPAHAEVWAYILDHARRLGEIPTKEDLRTLYQFDARDTGDLETYTQELISRHAVRKARSILLQHGPHLDSDPETTIRVLARELGALKLSGGRRIVYADRDATERLARFDAAAASLKAEGVVGIPTGLKWFDDRGYGFSQGDFIVVMGPSNVGKSFLAMYMAAYAYNSGRKVLVFSPEMPADEQSVRFDVLLANIRDVTLSARSLTTGQEDRNKYERWLKSLQNRSDLIIIDSSDAGRPLTYQDIWSFSAEHRPDMVFIDGLHLLKEEGTKGTRGGWEDLKDGSSYLKSMAIQQRIVLLSVHQGSRETARPDSGPATIDQAGYGFSVMQIADRVISLGYDKESSLRRVYTVPKMRGDETMTKRRYLNFDVNNGAIYELSEDEQNSFSNDEEF